MAEDEECTCTLYRMQTVLEPAEWEQDPRCPIHGDRLTEKQIEHYREVIDVIKPSFAPGDVRLLLNHIQVLEMDIADLKTATSIKAADPRKAHEREHGPLFSTRNRMANAYLGDQVAEGASFSEREYALAWNAYSAGLVAGHKLGADQ